jgi:integrase
MADYLQEIDGRFYYFRRVPKHLKRFDPRAHIKIALKTADRVEAGRLVALQNTAVEKFWRGLVANPSAAGSADAYKEAVATARAHGFAFRNVAQLEEGPVADLVERLRALQGKDDAAAARLPALLGGAEKPKMKLSEALDAYWPLVADVIAALHENKRDKWKQPRIRAMNNFIASAGDKVIADLTRRDVLDFKGWWRDRIVEEQLQPDTANKDLQHLKEILAVLVQDAELQSDVKAMFAETRFDFVPNSRPPYPIDFVQDKLLKLSVLAGMNEESRAVIYIMADTGARPDEIIGLDKSADVVLDAPIPYINIRPNETRGLKTRTSARQIPLVGAALYGVRFLMATKAGWFSRYTSADSASAAINKFLDGNNLKPEPDNTLYSLRHTFKDRLRDAGAPDEVMDSLMGHSSRKPKYGRGHILPTKLLWLEKIAFRPPC